MPLGARELEAGYARVLDPTKDSFENLRAMAFVFFEFYSRSHSYFDLLVTKRQELRAECSQAVFAEFEAAGASVIGPVAEMDRPDRRKN